MPYSVERVDSMIWFIVDPSSPILAPRRSEIISSWHGRPSHLVSTVLQDREKGITIDFQLLTDFSPDMDDARLIFHLASLCRTTWPENIVCSLRDLRHLPTCSVGETGLTPVSQPKSYHSLGIFWLSDRSNRRSDTAIP